VLFDYMKAIETTSDTWRKCAECVIRARIKMAFCVVLKLDPMITLMDLRFPQSAVIYRPADLVLSSKEEADEIH
jgi:hypothetical protein